MANLTKGANVVLDKGFTKIRAGLGWDTNTHDGADFDLDVSAFALGANGKIYAGDEKWFIFYGNLSGPDGAIIHTGDNLSGAGDGDDEVIKIDLAKIPEGVEKVAFVVTIHEAAARGQSFGQVRNGFIRLVDDVTDAEQHRYDLTEDYSTETAVQFAELYRKDGDWKFKAIGSGYTGGLAKFCEDYGITVS